MESEHADVDDLLKWLATNKDAAPWAAAFFTFVATLVALVGAPLVQRWIALRLQRGSVVSANRVRWIEDFRKDVAAFCELAHHVAYHRARMAKAERQRNKAAHDESRKEINDKTVDLNTIYYHLILRLNPAKQGTQQIKDKLQEIDEACNDIPEYDDGFYRHINRTIDQLLTLVRDYLSAEWNKVEKLQ